MSDSPTEHQDPRISFIESNKRLARTWWDEIINNRDLSALDRAYSPDYTHSGPDGHRMDRDGARDVAQMLLASSHDRRAEVVIQVAEGDRVVTRWRSEGTQTGEMFGRPASGKKVTAEGVVISRIKGGQIIEDWELTRLDFDS